MFRFLANLRLLRTYAYLSLSFPLGLVYFILLVLGISLGAGLAVLGIGILILIATLFGVAAAATFERQLANTLLDTDIPPMRYWSPAGSGMINQIKVLFSKGRILRDLVYISLRFPFGIGALIMLVLTLLPISMILSPFYFNIEGANVTFGPIEEITTLPEALLASLAGFILLPLVVYASHLMVQIWKGLTVALLGGGEVDEVYFEKSKRHTVRVPTEKAKRHEDDYLPYDEPFVSDFDDDRQPRRSLADLIGEMVDEKKQEK